MLDSKNVDLERLRKELAVHAARSKALKAQLRRPWVEPMADVQRALQGCRRRTTELCILRAWMRGRFHLERPLREGAYPGMKWDRARYHALVAERVAAELAVAVAS